MKIKDLRKIINDFPEVYDDLEVWIDTDAWEGGKPADDVQIKYAGDCSLDGDEMCGDEFFYTDDILKKFNLTEIPPEDSVEFTKIIMALNAEHYRYDGSQFGECQFSKKILSIKF